ncbi:hypothetical protein GCM10017781_44210 [Deinococcus metalli]|uniref:Uncharacterized protein n=1 Tax=Deinococcus metalli TaxID=1141878 RepID=A0ABQ3JX99_9DEIO|nr:hypothetical protein GCM10017781_44210 [Deinococcus metalli]
MTPPGSGLRQRLTQPLVRAALHFQVAMLGPEVLLERPRARRIGAAEQLVTQASVWCRSIVVDGIHTGRGVAPPLAFVCPAP